ncbi:MAG: tetrathionate reductase family octaheme c-type cytochrome [bacterium]|nr:tetrathionate reductase family octaheme c-type cytochrome [bacterium]
MKRIFLVVIALAILTGLVVTTLPKKSEESTPLALLREKFHKKSKAVVDHSKFDVLKKDFKRPQDVTAACISCHDGRAAEVMKSSHWNWERLEYIPNKGIRSVGKKNILNNFCIGISGNQPSCNKCHIGYGYANNSFDFHDSLNVDCISCHDNSNTYLKKTGGAGMPDSSVNLTKVAQQVGMPQRTNCGTCHFYGGGGNNVKHGDLEESMFDPEHSVDVHMASEKSNLQCVDCHTADQHQILGKSYSLSSMNRNRVTCEQCHSALPHTDKILNQHTVKIACQTCHIPVYAKVNPTKLHWDWSTAGKLRNGEPYEETDSTGSDVYMSIKGSFRWGKNVTPEYYWFNGTASHYLLGDQVDTTKPVKMNELFGSYDDPDAKIYPVKVHRAKQLYDTQNKYLIQPKTYSSTPGDSGYWAEFDWPKAITAGMKEINLPYSGQFGFINTEMYWPINHMVSPAKQTVQCIDCHTRDNGRLAGLTDFYLPGRDYNPWIERIGKLSILFTLMGVIVHGSIRWYMHRKVKGGK